MLELDYFCSIGSESNLKPVAVKHSFKLEALDRDCGEKSRTENIGFDPF
jgi:hypothetical protein